MKKSEPELRNPDKFWNAIAHFHGPNRYQDTSKRGVASVNGATALIECNPEFPADLNADPAGKGSVHAWFVGSPRAFLFGLTRSGPAAARKMHQTLVSEILRLIPGATWNGKTIEVPDGQTLEDYCVDMTIEQITGTGADSTGDAGK